MLQPVVVRRVPEDARDGEARYELIMGERRWRASRAAGKDVVPAIIKVTEEDDLLRDALLENLHRSQLNALEEAAAYQQLLDDFGCTQEELAGGSTARARRSPTRCACSSCRRPCSGASPPACSAPVTPARCSACRDAAAMERMAQRIVAEGLSVRTVEELVTLGDDTSPAGPPRPAAPAAAVRSSTTWPPTSRTASRPGCSIALGQRKGRLTVEFASVEDLNRILDAMHLRDEREA